MPKCSTAVERARRERRHGGAQARSDRQAATRIRPAVPSSASARAKAVSAAAGSSRTVGSAGIAHALDEFVAVHLWHPEDTDADVGPR